MLVTQIMSQPVAACQVSDTLDQAARLMWEKDCGAVPVLDGFGRVIAMLTDRDICMAAYTQGKPLSEISVRSSMSKELFSCQPMDSVSTVEQLMRQHQIRRLPVLDLAGLPVGMLSLNDVALAAAHQHPGAPGSTNGISLVSTAETLAALCAHRLESVGPRLA